MANEPLNIFSARADPQGVLDRLLARFPDAEVETEADTWRKITIRLDEEEEAKSLTFLHDPDYYAGPGWARQKAGMQGYFDRFPAGDRKPRLMSTIGTFQFSLATHFEPDFDPDGDERLSIVFDVARFLDGVLFTPSALRDAQGRILVSADGSVDEDAVWPRVGFIAQIPANAEEEEDEEEDEPPTPPTAQRVARRAVALLFVVGRAVIERDLLQETASAEEARQMHGRLLAWLDEVGIEDELEPDESETVRQLPGELLQQEAINAMWRVEGLTVLAWALGRFPMPRYDELVNIDDVWQALGFLRTGEVRELLARPALRPRDELETFRKQMLGYHWRLRDFQWARPRAMDFLAFSKKCWFGSFDVTPFELIDNDLALRASRIDEAPPEVLDLCGSIAAERHLAINWLCWGPDRYSAADRST
jgi:hypothetical protein